MNLPIFWTDEAEIAFESVVLFIENKWSKKEADKFLKRTQKILALIAKQPYMYKASINNNVRQAIFYETNIHVL